jgi:UDP-glucose 4-epimerase
MAQRKVLVTGPCGLIGSEEAAHFSRQGFQVDNNDRAVFFRSEGDSSWVPGRLSREIPIAHSASQPSRDHATAIPFLDFNMPTCRLREGCLAGPIHSGVANACSVLEAFDMASQVSGEETKWRYVDENRIGDHTCYYSDLRTMMAHHPVRDITKPLATIFEKISNSWMVRLVPSPQ